MLGSAVILIPVAVAMFVLIYLSKGLMALGLAEETSMLITVVVVIALSVYMLYVFATRFIDW